MRFQYSPARLPRNRALIQDVNAAATRLHDKLRGINPAALDISQYNQRYLRDHLANLRGTLQKYAFLVSWSLAGNERPLDDFVFVDYGGGCGIPALLAKECGVGTVLYNDIYDVSCRDARRIGEAVDWPADHYVEGGIGELIEFCRARSIRARAVASYDVIEHVYDIEDLFSRLAELSSGNGMTVVMASGANAHNPRIRRRLTELHRQVEHETRPRKFGHKERDSLKAYFDLRAGIIADHAPTLSAPEREKLAQATRGLVEPEICACVDRYVATGQMPEELEHPTNTCDPFTGNWAEHLMDTRALRDTLARSGYVAEVMSGYYPSPANAAKAVVTAMLNGIIRLLGPRGLALAPYYVLYGKQPAPVRTDEKHAPGRAARKVAGPV